MTTSNSVSLKIGDWVVYTDEHLNRFAEKNKEDTTENPARQIHQIHLPEANTIGSDQIILFREDSFLSGEFARNFRPASPAEIKETKLRSLFSKERS